MWYLRQADLHMNHLGHHLHWKGSMIRALARTKLKGGSQAGRGWSIYPSNMTLYTTREPHVNTHCTGSLTHHLMVYAVHAFAKVGTLLQKGGASRLGAAPRCDALARALTISQTRVIPNEAISS